MKTIAENARTSKVSAIDIEKRFVDKLIFFNACICHIIEIFTRIQKNERSTETDKEYDPHSHRKITNPTT